MKKLFYLLNACLCLCFIGCTPNKTNELESQSAKRVAHQTLNESFILDQDGEYVEYFSASEAEEIAEYFIGSAEYIQSVDSVSFSQFFPAFQIMLPAMLYDYDISLLEECNEYYAPQNVLYIVKINRPDFIGSVLVSGINNRVLPVIDAVQGVSILPEMFDLNSFVQDYSSEIEAATTDYELMSFYSAWWHNNGGAPMPVDVLIKLLRRVFIEFFNQFCWQCNEPVMPCGEFICHDLQYSTSDEVLYFNYRDCDDYDYYSSFSIALLKVFKHEHYPYYSSSIVDETELDCSVLSNITYHTNAYPDIATQEFLTDTATVKLYLLQRELLISRVNLDGAMDDIMDGKLVLVEHNGRWGIAYNIYVWCDPCNNDSDRIALVTNFDYNMIMPDNTMRRIVETIDVSEGEYHFYRYEPYYSGSTFSSQQNQ